MPKYEVEFEIPFFNEPSDMELWFEALREVGHPKIIYRAEGETRLKVAEEAAYSMSLWWPRYDKDWWQRKLRVVRGRRSEPGI